MSVQLTERMKCSECPIRHRAVCARCDDTELERLEKIKSYRSFRAGETIIWRGDDLHHVSSVVSGIATLSKTLDDGRVQMVGLLLPSDFIGHPGRKTLDFDVTAATDVVLCSFERKPFEKLLVETPHISQRLVEMAMDELDAARDWMVLLGRKTAREKLASFIQMLVQRSHIEGSGMQEMTLPLTREEIASYLGLTLETVSRQFSQFRKEGILSFTDRRRFTVADHAALLEATGDDADGGVII
ncbi:MAG: Crp/Fnr family transcriptional regulator [Silicimonas sp.]|nr:Crp/Fnr family transcriptional regulator [Silicimonas sp.]